MKVNLILASWESFGKWSLLFLMFLVKYERIKFLVIALKNSVEIYAWAPKPYHKFMAFKVQQRTHKRTTCIFSDSFLTSSPPPPSPSLSCSTVPSWLTSRWKKARG